MPTNWVDEGDGDVPDGKEDALPSRFPSEQEITAAEWNEVMQMLQDLRTSFRRGGEITIEDAADVGVVNFSGFTMPDDEYLIEISVGFGGAPADGARQATWNSRQTTGFTVNLLEAPGSGESVIIHWKVTSQNSD